MTPKRTNIDRLGSALIMALYFILGIGIIMGVYIKMAYKELEFSDSSFMLNSLLNQAESVVEDATWALNNCDDDADWIADGWTVGTGAVPSMRKKISGINLGNGKTGTAYVIVEDYQDEPTIYVEARTTLLNGRVISKQLQIDLEEQPLLATGLIAKDGFTVSGNVGLDSYNSSVAPYIWDAATNRNSNITTGSLSSDPSAVTISGTIDVYGVLGTGGSAPNIQPPSTVTSSETPVGVSIDPNQISTSLSGQFQDPVAPETTGYTIDLPGGNSLNGANVVPIGTPGGPVVEYLLSTDLSMSANSTLLVLGPVIIVMGPDKSVDVSGSAQISVTATGSLTFYTDGDFTISGTGMVNASTIPSNLIIYGTDPVPNGQSITLSGTADLQAVVYTPNAQLTISGTNETSGAVVANAITMSGTTDFHYDEALADFFGGSDDLQLDRWREMVSATDKTNLQSILTTGFGSGTYP